VNAREHAVGRWSGPQRSDEEHSMADEDVAAERARLEALAWGAGVAPEDAAAARVALAAMERGSAGGRSGRSGGAGHLRGGPVDTRRPGDAGSVGRVGPVTPGRPGGAGHVDGSGAGSVGQPGGAGHVGSVGPVAAGRPGGAAADRGTGAGGSADAPDGAARPAGAGVGRTAPDADGRATSAEATGPGEPLGALDRDDDGAGAVGGGGERLQAGLLDRRTSLARLVGPGRRRAWTLVGAAAAVGVAFVAGTLVGTAREVPAAAPTVTPSAGTISLEDLLDAPQTYADQLPGALEAPVSLRSTRLIFSNRALDGGSFATPWSVWAGVGTDRSTICLVATPNRIQSTSACYPRQDALHGSVSLSAQSMSGTLTLMLRGGGVQGAVTNAD
jgi:hypothetical protein